MQVLGAARACYSSRVRVLAIDTSSDTAAVALVSNGALLGAVQARVQHQHGETLLPHIDAVLAQGGVTIAEVELLAVGLGPGSFTGARIGVATAKGLALARRTPMVGVRTSRVLARASRGALRLVAIDAKKDEVFGAAYRMRDDGVLERLFEDEHASPTVMAQRLASVRGLAAAERECSLVGSALGPHRALFEAALPGVYLEDEALGAPHGAWLAAEALEAFAARGPDDPAALVPIYVRGADAKLPG